GEELPIAGVLGLELGELGLNRLLRDAIAIRLERPRQQRDPDDHDERDDREREALELRLEPAERALQGLRGDADEAPLGVRGLPRGDVRLVLAGDGESFGHAVSAEELVASAREAQAQDEREEGAALVVARRDDRALRELAQRLVELGSGHLAQREVHRAG